MDFASPSANAIAIHVINHIISMALNRPISDS